MTMNPPQLPPPQLPQALHPSMYSARPRTPDPMGIEWWMRAAVITGFLCGLVGSAAIMVMRFTVPEPSWWSDLLMPFAFVYLWLTPFGLALVRGHRNSGAIGVLNLVLGLTGIGWIVALIWACTETDKTTR